MVLCPFVFLLTHPAVPALNLQPTEVGSTHWVSLRALLSPSLRTFELADMSDRLAGRRGLVARHVLRLMLGQMRFAAVRLIPTESLYCSSVPGFLPCSSPPASPSPRALANSTNLTAAEPQHATLLATLTHHLRSLNTRPDRPGADKPLLLWGLTLDIAADFLDMLPPHNEASRWEYPTYTPLDIRLVSWLVTYSFRRRKRIAIERGASVEGRGLARVEVGLDAVASSRGVAEAIEESSERTDIGEGGGQVSKARRGQRGLRTSAVRVMLDGYFDILRKAVILAVVLRLGVGAAVGLALWRRLRRGRRWK